MTPVTPEDQHGPPLPAGRTPEVVASALSQDQILAPLRQHPPEAPGADAADRLLLDTAAAWFSAGHPTRDIAVIDDRWGALTLGLLAGVPQPSAQLLRVGQDTRGAEIALVANAARLGLSTELGAITRGPGVTAELLAGAHTVLMPLPRSLETLADWAWTVAEHAAEDVVMLAGGRDKHMTRSMNDVLSAQFTDVVPGRGRGKARVITARGPRRGREAPFPRRHTHRDVTDLGLDQDLTLCAEGAVYGGTSLDPGTRFLLSTLAGDAGGELLPHGGEILDLGCGNGTIAAWAALRDPRAQVVAVDQSASAVTSTRRTAEAAGVADRVRTMHDDALSSWEDGSVSTILLNPPFHRGNAVDPSVAHRLFSDVGRVLRPGGKLLCVWNSHLRHRPMLQREVGPTRQLARNPKFTVTESVKPD
ncbi:class I SAM-dependent methyltransferase [Nesterenkonia sp. HG001]|uniref:class I SAM-dependent methyltransferase n=1 Tax=Nesterenkonia sp. HG001 TaxID=2983207 RepID=UPI002AC50E99|nr:class I SAM-dependent methyltransferase [Nesterenkonia sp. HG001]MDZ5078034.1 class I SAM-dependent methyltransferase [Nesterenkonia sp. HG001]